MQDNLNTFSVAAAQSAEARSQFIWKCYAHVAGAILALVAVEAYLFASGAAYPIANAMMQSPMVVLIGFIATAASAVTFLPHVLDAVDADNVIDIV